MAKSRSTRPDPWTRHSPALGAAPAPWASLRPGPDGALPSAGVSQLLSRLVDASGKFQCPLCRQEYASEAAMNVHRTHFHEGDMEHPNRDSDGDACMLDLLARKASDTQITAVATSADGSDTAGKATAKSGDSPIGGVKPSAKFQCPDCSQTFGIERALTMHHKWIHGEDGTGGPANVGYTLVYEFDNSKLINADKVETPGNSPIVPQPKGAGHAETLSSPPIVVQLEGNSPAVPQLEGTPSPAPGASEPRTRRREGRDPRDPFSLMRKAKRLVRAVSKL